MVMHSSNEFMLRNGKNVGWQDRGEGEDVSEGIKGECVDVWCVCE